MNIIVAQHFILQLFTSMPIDDDGLNHKNLGWSSVMVVMVCQFILYCTSQSGLMITVHSFTKGGKERRAEEKKEEKGRRTRRRERGNGGTEERNCPPKERGFPLASLFSTNLFSPFPLLLD